MEFYASYVGGAKGSVVKGQISIEKDIEKNKDAMKKAENELMSIEDKGLREKKKKEIEAYKTSIENSEKQLKTTIKCNFFLDKELVRNLMLCIDLQKRAFSNPRLPAIECSLSLHSAWY
jgi:hypothetical protein